MPSFKSVRALRAAVPLLGLVALSACGPRVAIFAPTCPTTGILRDAADLTRFRGTGTDLTDMVIDGRITGLAGKCMLDDRTHLHTVISVGMDLTRGPANTTRTDDVTYFVAVAQGDTILDKRTFVLPIGFARNVEQIRLTGDPVNIVLPVDAKTSGASYRILVGFQLTPQELAFNRSRGVR
jgi:hypothetical protein